jgi:hypothetical protein
MAYIYNYKIVTIEKKKENNIDKGLVIGVICEKISDGTSVVNSSYIDWFASSSEFLNWPDQTSSDIKEYVESYLNSEDETGVVRKTKLKNIVDKPKITFEEDNSVTEQDKNLSL